MLVGHCSEAFVFWKERLSNATEVNCAKLVLGSDAPWLPGASWWSPFTGRVFKTFILWSFSRVMRIEKLFVGRTRHDPSLFSPTSAEANDCHVFIIANSCKCKRKIAYSSFFFCNMSLSIHKPATTICSLWSLS